MTVGHPIQKCPYGLFNLRPILFDFDFLFGLALELHHERLGLLLAPALVPGQLIHFVDSGELVIDHRPGISNQLPGGGLDRPQLLTLPLQPPEFLFVPRRTI